MYSTDDSNNVTTPPNTNFGRLLLNIEPDKPGHVPAKLDNIVEPHSSYSHPDISSSNSEHSILQKPGSLYKSPVSHRQSPRHHTNSASTILTDNMSNTTNQNTGMEQQKMKRGWRFYGTFFCLAILNFICAVDATILSVALPVSTFLYDREVFSMC